MVSLKEIGIRKDTSVTYKFFHSERIFLVLKFSKIQCITFCIFSLGETKKNFITSERTRTPVGSFYHFSQEESFFKEGEGSQPSE